MLSIIKNNNKIYYKLLSPKFNFLLKCIKIMVKKNNYINININEC